MTTASSEPAVGRTDVTSLEDVTEEELVQGRGRQARDPRAMPWRAWRDVAWRVYKRIILDRVGLIAAGVTFYAILGLFPAIVALVSVYGLLTDTSALQEQLQWLSGYVPEDALTLLSNELRRIAQARPDSLGIAALISTAVALWSVNTAVLALFNALNVAYGETEKRSLPRLYGTGFAVTLGIILFAVITVNSIVVLPVVLVAVGLDGRVDFFMRIAMAPIFFCLMVAAASVFYRIGPSRRDARWRWITLGSVVFAAVWITAALSLSFYLSRFADYSATYGSLGAAIGLMLWIYAAVYIFLIGAELNSELEHQTAEDTTVGRDRPLGQRGAHVADTLGRLAD
ncbi:YihY/virulence factor BrkB family protein [Amorphus orientalis]|uniref:Membrane protein n=1 Tax=Amorphus orientalis TaxID=649198 RepID=A0AAE3VQC5_9HYPH|nr:YihY/virulence factor BrkB family protein [Amorphus orientalis]MDQ0316369.1 membrane protein [Amorphus orientalis]